MSNPRNPRKAKKIPLTIAKERLSYDRFTGELTWKHLDYRNNRWNTRYAGKTAGYVNQEGYLFVKLDSEAYPAHRVIWALVNGEIPDYLGVNHIDGNKRNNRIANLRLVTASQKQVSRKRNKAKSLPKGIYWNGPRRRYHVDLKYKGERYYGGIYQSLNEAKAVLAAMQQRIHGEFSRAA